MCACRYETGSEHHGKQWRLRIRVHRHSRVLCKICQNPCRDAYLTGCCGTNFCYSCLQQLKKGTVVNKSCPMCREEKFRIFPNKGLDSEIKSLSIYCENLKGGCTWSGEINDVKKHITADCHFVEVTCPSKCGMMLKRQCIQQEVAKECPCHCQHWYHRQEGRNSIEA